jgi:hypothetical protein
MPTAPVGGKGSRRHQDKALRDWTPHPEGLPVHFIADGGRHIPSGEGARSRTTLLQRDIANPD